MIWTLILFAYVGALSDHDSMALATVPGFKSEKECVFAGEQSKKMAVASTKVIKYTCVQVTQ
jgi:hypothetical protein